MNPDTQMLANKLFSDVTQIRKKYEEEIKSSGESFNVFHILGLSTNEVRTHTSFIRDLLHPEGSHGHGEIFLSLFLEYLKSKGRINLPKDFFQSGRMFVEKEKTIGIIDSDYLNGGNIDLLIVNHQQQGLIIENKIYAADGKNQLLRYYNFGKKEYTGGYSLFYLTLDGRAASEWSLGGILATQQYERISYAVDILAWLKKCRDHTVQLYKQNNKECHLQLLATIMQYIHLVESLTGQTKYNKMENEIMSRIKVDPSSFEIAKIISEQYNKLFYEVIPENARQAIDKAWKARFSDPDELKLFSYKALYDVFISVSDEQRWHIQIWPQIKDQKGVANDKEVAFIKQTIENSEYRNRNFPNHNYPIWLYSEREFKTLSTDDYRKLSDKQYAEKWAETIVIEAENILRLFIRNLPEEVRNDIEWNEANQKLKELVDAEYSSKAS